MELTISVSEEIGNVLLQRAKENGRDVREFVKSLVEDQALSPTLDELLAPARTEFAESGTTENDLDEFMYSLRDKVNNEKGSPDNS